MKTCNCTLPYFNGPDVCKGCSNWEEPSQTNPYQQNWYPETKRVKKITKTIDKYDNEGVYIGREVITEEYEEIDKPVWDLPYWTTSNDFVINYVN